MSSFVQIHLIFDILKGSVSECLLVLPHDCVNPGQTYQIMRVVTHCTSQESG